MPDRSNVRLPEMMNTRRAPTGNRLGNSVRRPQPNTIREGVKSV